MKLVKLNTLNESLELNERFLNDVVKISEFKDYLKQYENRVCIWFDTETTGFANTKFQHQLTQVAAIATEFKIVDDKLILNEVGSFNQKANLTAAVRNKMSDEEVDPERPKDKKISYVLGFTRYGESGGNYVPEAELLDSYLAWIKEMSEKTGGKDIVLIAQNAGFDMSFLSRSSKLYKNERIFNNFKVFDTVKLFQKFWTPILMVKADAGDMESKRILNSTGRGFKGLPSMSLGKVAKVINIDPTGWHDARADVDMMIKVTQYVINEILSSREDEELVTNKQRVIFNKLK